MKKYSIGFAVFHLVAFLIFLFFMATQSEVAQHQLNWIFWMIADFPISLLFFVFVFMGGESFFFVIFVHGILGTIWWYFLPRLMLAADPKYKKKPNQSLEADD